MIRSPEQVRIVAAFALALGTLLAGARECRADWLVLVDGTALEIDGAPEVRGRMIVFTLPDGALSSLRASEVDLDASTRRTRLEARRRTLARRPPPEPPAVEREAVFVLTDADVGHVSSAPENGTAEKEGSSGGSDGEERGPAQKLVVRQWGQDRAERGLAVFGVLENRDLNAAAAVRLTVIAVDSTGAEVARQSAALDTTTLLPGQSTRFSAAFAEFPPPIFDSIEFDVESIAIKAGSGGEQAPGAGGDAPSGSARLP